MQEHPSTPGKDCHHLTTYGLSCNEYDQLRNRASGRCEICRTPQAETARGTLVIDHFQGGGAWFVRGLLCDKCNAVMACHDRAMPWGPKTHPYRQRARDYHLNAWGRPTTEELAAADAHIKTRTPFTVRGLPRSGRQRKHRRTPRPP